MRMYTRKFQLDCLIICRHPFVHKIVRASISIERSFIPPTYLVLYSCPKMFCSPEARLAMPPPTHCGLTEFFKHTDISSPREQAPAAGIQALRHLNFTQPNWSQIGPSQYTQSQELGYGKPTNKPAFGANE